jgi:uncharacterized cupredoxin-like copper-binding protein
MQVFVVRTFALAVFFAIVGIARIPWTQPAAAASQTITVPVDVHDMAVVPTQTVFRVGQTYNFVVTNTGKATHELVIEPAGAVDEALQVNGQ